MSSSTGTQIIGHSGSGSHGPPSSAAAIREGLDRGAVAMQLDVQFASDSTPIVFHDRTLARSAGVNGTIRNQDARELGGYDVGFRFGDRFRGARLLTVEEAAGLVPEKLDIYLDIKDFDPVNAKHVRGLLSVLKRQGGLARCVILSTSESVLATLGSQDRSVRRGLRTQSARSESVSRAASLGCGSLHPEAGSTRRALVEACREGGMLIIPHSADDGRVMRNMIDLEVDGVTTGHPERLAEISRSKGTSRRRPSPRREPRPSAAPSGEERPAERAEATPEAASGARGRGQRDARGGAGPEIPGPAPPEQEAARAGRPSGEAPSRRQAGDAPPAAAETPSEGRRRRRGRRGGRREQARRARKTEPGPEAAEEPGAAAEVIPLEPVEEEEESGTLELLGEIHAELDRESGAGEAGTGGGNGRKRRRRGRRGGKRVQARRQKKKTSGGGPAS